MDAIEISLVATDKTKAAFSSLNESMGKAGESSGGLASKLAGLGAAAIASAAVIGAALVAGAQHAISADVEWGQTLEELVKRFGMSGESASGYAVAMQHVGLTVDEGAQGLNYFARQLDAVDKTTASGKAKITPFDEALSKLGVSAHDSSGKLKTFDEIMPEIMDKFKQMPEGVNSTALAMEMFGARGGSKFIEFLRQGGGSIAQFTQVAKDMGLSMSTEDIDATEQFSRSMNDLGMSVQGIWVTIGSQLMPIIKDLTTFITTQVVPIFKQWASDNMPKVVEGLRFIGTFITANVLPALKAYGEYLGLLAKGDFGKAFSMIGDALAQIDWGGLGASIVSGLGAAFGELQSLGSQLAGWLGDVGRRILTFLATSISSTDWGQVASIIGTKLGQALSGLSAGVGTVGNVGLKLLQRIADQLNALDWTRLVAVLGDALGRGLAGAGATISAAFDALGHVNFGKLVDNIGDALGSAFSGKGGGGGWLSKMIDAVGQQFGSIDWNKVWQGAGDIAGRIVSGFGMVLSGVGTLLSKEISWLLPALGTLASDIATQLGKDIQGETDTITGDLKSLGESAIKGLIDGINAHAQEVIDAIVKIIQDAINWVKALLGIKSPSTVFHEIGMNMAQGLISGWNAGLNVVPAHAFVVGGGAGGGRVIAGGGGGGAGANIAGGGFHVHLEGSTLTVTSENDISSLANYLYELFAQERAAIQAHGGQWGG